MNKKEVLEKVMEICKDIFENEELEFVDTIGEWDSLIYLSVISDIEDEFGIEFTLDEISSCKIVEDLANVICKHRGE